jgi:hypothetical protein
LRFFGGLSHPFLFGPFLVSFSFECLKAPRFPLAALLSEAQQNREDHMNRLKRTLVAAAGATVLALSLTVMGGGHAMAQGMKPLLVQIINTDTNPVPVTPVLGAADRVQLELQGGPSEVCEDSSRDVRRVMPDGTTVASFSVPAGKILVLTDMEGVVSPEVPWSAGRVASLTAFIRTPGLNIPRLTALAPLNADAVASETMSLTIHLQSGVFGASGAVCVSATTLFGGGFAVATVERAQLQGYLIPE